MLGRYQATDTEASQGASLLLNQLCEGIIKSANSQCERSRQMDEHLSAGYLEPGESDLFSELVCLISPAWCWKAEHASAVLQMQEVVNRFIAGETGLCELNSPGLLAFLSLD